MRDLMRQSRAASKNRLVFGIFVFVVLVLFGWQAMAIDVQLFDRPLAIKGYINQSAQFGVAGDKYDTMQGFQQGIMQALLELEYYPADDLKLFTTGLLYKDWAYNIYDSDDDWEFRRFKEARNEMSLRTDYEDVLKECHVTWTPPGFNIRVGKQIVSWGRMDGVRIMDQINPVDQRLGPSDVEFETTIIPIWLAKVEYYPGYKPPFLDEFGIEFTYNPNADFIGTKKPGPGNYQSGIWAPDIINSGLRVGETQKDFDEPDKWSDGHEYAVRVNGTLPDATYFTLNFFDGVDNDPVFHSTGAIDIVGSDDKGRPIIEPYLTGAYKDKRYAGFTFSRDFNELYIRSLGGVAPLIRCEALYEFDTWFTRSNRINPLDNEFEQHDAIYWGFGIDWKFKWNLLNPRRYFSLVPQFSMRHIRDFPSGPSYLSEAGGVVLSENNYSVSVRLDTYYLHDKLQPFIYFQRDIKQDVTGITSGKVSSDIWLFRLNYQPNHIWTYKAQLTLFSNDGYEEDDQGMHNKDNVSFTVQYQF